MFDLNWYFDLIDTSVISGERVKLHKKQDFYKKKKKREKMNLPEKTSPSSLVQWREIQNTSEKKR